MFPNELNKPRKRRELIFSLGFRCRLGCFWCGLWLVYSGFDKDSKGRAKHRGDGCYHRRNDDRDWLPIMCFHVPVLRHRREVRKRLIPLVHKPHNKKPGAHFGNSDSAEANAARLRLRRGDSADAGICACEGRNALMISFRARINPLSNWISFISYNS